MPPTELLLIRHGEKEWNREGRIQGHLDIPLSETGIQQAEALAERLAGTAFDALYSSDLARARLTAERVARRTGHRIVTDPRLRERHLGVLQACTADETTGPNREAYAAFRGGTADYVIPGGESGRGFFARVIGVLTEIAERLAGGRVVVVTHGGVLDAVHRHAAGKGPEGPRAVGLLNTSLNVFRFEAGRWSMLTWGDVGHLEGGDSRDDI
jgi:2,3-bisphosphoglycerate-dependent phosphoglycerate mutase